MAKALDAHLRGGRAAARLAQDQARAHPGPRGAGRRVGPRPAARLAQQPAPRRARSGDRRLRHARQDLQGHDRRDAGLADGEAPGARDRRATPDLVYVRPELVVEVAFNDIQASPHYPGGIALRFARVKRYRPDKRAAGCRHHRDGACDLRGADRRPWLAARLSPDRRTWTSISDSPRIPAALGFVRHFEDGVGSARRPARGGAAETSSV